MCFSHHLTRTSWFCCNCDGDAWDSENSRAVSDQLCPHTEQEQTGAKRPLEAETSTKARFNLGQVETAETWNYMGLQNKVGWMPRYYLFILNIHSLPPEWRNHTLDCCWMLLMLFISIYAIVLLDGYQQIRFQTHAFFRRNRFVGCGARCGAKLLDFGRPGRRYRVIADAPSAMFARSIPIGAVWWSKFIWGWFKTLVPSEAQNSW